MSRSSIFVSVILVALLGAVLAPSSRSDAQSTLRTGGSSANFGSFDLRGGFMPDPTSWSVTSGGSLAASSAAPRCAGHVSAQPDIIVRYTSPASFVRFFARSSSDTTLVINDPRGRWLCSDDEGGGHNPMIDIASPAAGQYDIWIGSYRAGEMSAATVHMTELTSNRP